MRLSLYSSEFLAFCKCWLKCCSKFRLSFPSPPPMTRLFEMEKLKITVSWKLLTLVVKSHINYFYFFLTCLFYSGSQLWHVSVTFWALNKTLISMAILHLYFRRFLDDSNYILVNFSSFFAYFIFTFSLWFCSLPKAR